MPSVVLFFLLAAIVSYLIFRSFVHPVVVFNILWFVVITISTYVVESLGYYKPSPYIYNIFLVGGIFFNIGAILFRVFSPYKKSTKRIVEFPPITDNKIKLFIIAQVILAVYYTYKSYYIGHLLSTGQTYDAIRDIYFSDEMTSSPLEILSVMLLFDPLLILTETLLAINLFAHILPSKMNYLMLYNLLLKSFLSAGRTAVFETGCLILISAVFFGIFKGANKKKAIGVFAGIFILFYAMALISAQRRGGEFGVFEIAFTNLTSYFTGSFPFFDDVLKSKDYLEPMYGLVTLGGVIDVFIHFFKLLHLTDMPLVYVSTGSILAEFRPIGDTAYYNAMPTMYYYFYTDFRELGYVLCPFIFGGVSVGVYRIIQQSGTLLSYVYYLFLMILIIESSFNWQLSRLPFFVAMVYAYFYLHSTRRTKTIRRLR